MNQNNVLVRSERDPLFGFTPEGFVEVLKHTLNGRVEEAYFFGGFATQDLNPHSDIDIILVQDTQKNFLERGKDFLDLYDLIPSIDLLVYTPEEFRKLTENPSLGFWESVTCSLKRFI